MTNTLDDICQSGSFCNSFVYHICGMPWAATNSLELKEILDATTVFATSLRKKLFGGESYYDVQVLPILQHELGPQRIEYSETKGITVGGWSVKLSSDPSGFVWQNGSDLEQWGVLGLDWQPETNVKGAKWSVLASDVVPNLVDNTVTLEWPLGQDTGIKAWLDAKWTGSAYSEELYIYSSSSCFKPIAAPVASGQGVSVACNSAQFNAPNESVLSVEEGQSIYLTNYPQGIEGLTANLYGVQIADGGLIDGAGFGHESFGHYPFGHTEPVEAGSIVTTGDTPIFLRSGKVKANATTDNSGRWSISMGGITDQFKFKSNTARFSGSLYGFEFNRTQSPSLGGQVAYSPYDIAIRENYDDVVTPTALTLLTLGDPNRNSATNQGNLQQQILDALNGWVSSKCVFHASGEDDITWEESTATVVKSVYVSGPAISAAGLGYVGYQRIPTWLKTLSDPLNNNVGQSILSDHGEPAWDGGLPFSETVFPETPAMCLRPVAVTDSVFRDGATNTLDDLGLIRNRATFEYYISYDNSQNNVPAQNYTNNLRLTEKVPMAVPENDAGDQILKISKNESSEISTAIGDVIGFGAWTNGNNIYGQVSGINGDEITFLSNIIYGMPSSFYWCKSLPDLLDSDSQYRDQMQAALDKLNAVSANGIAYTTVEDVINLFSFGDPFRVNDITAVSSTGPVDILKQLIGDPNTDTGLSNAMVQTSIKNIFERGDALSFVPFIDWDRLDELLAANNLPGAQYVFSLERQDASGTDWMAMFNGVLMTHGIEMTYEYTELYRCWWISFKPFNEGNLGSATIGGNLIDDTDIASNDVQGQSGGGWYYSRIAASYKSTQGEEVNLSYKMRNGRIGNTLKDRTLTIKDSMTLLPMNYDAPAEIIQEFNFANMLHQFARVVYKQKLILKMKKAARIGVGLWSSATWSPLLSRIVGRRNAGSLSGEVSGISINLTSMTIEADIMTTAGGGLAIGPSLDIDTSSKLGTVVTATGISKTVSENTYQDPADGLTDLAWFGCFQNIAGIVSARDCGCTGFRVTVFERNPPSRELFYDPAYLYAGQNVWRGTMQVIGIDDVTGAGTASITITLDGNGTAYDTGAEYVAVFADRADDALQPCQTDLFGWLGNSSGKVIDSDTNESIAIMVDS